MHLVPDSNPLRPDPVLDFPAVNLSDSATEGLPQRLEAEDDPLELMGSVIDTTTAEVHPTTPLPIACSPLEPNWFANCFGNRGRAFWIVPRTHNYQKCNN